MLTKCQEWPQTAFHLTKEGVLSSHLEATIVPTLLSHIRQIEKSHSVVLVVVGHEGDSSIIE